MTTKFVIYRRISGGTNQIKSGLGLEAQMTEINCYLQGVDDYQIVEEYTEIASGKDHQNRPILQSAIEKSIQTNSIVLVSRICRLSRDLEFTASLMKSNKVKFRIATMPTADNFIIAIYAAMVQKDLKYVIGYSSVSHMGYVLMGIATLHYLGLTGAVLQMFSHGVMTALFFAVVGMIY